MKNFDVIIIVLISIMIGLIIVKIVDVRLKNISINMPAVNLPTIHITVQDEGKPWAVKETKIETTGSNSNSNSNSPANANQKAGAPPQLLVPPLDTHFKIQRKISPDTKIPNVQSLPEECKDRTRYIVSRYTSASNALKNTGKTPDASSYHTEMFAPYPRKESALNKVSEPLATGGGNYYMDPKLMTLEQQEKFKNKAKMEKMTVHDYTNWLNLFRGSPEKLSGFHRANLSIITHGGQLTQNDLPRVTAVPPSADHEYMAMIKQGTLVNIPQPESLGYLPYNYDVDVGPEPSRNMRHLDFVNPDEPLKTWVLTKESKKISP